jgi:hypothetical protein
MRIKEVNHVNENEKERKKESRNKEWKIMTEICLLLDTKGMSHNMKINANKKI